MGQTVIEKITQAHLSEPSARPVHAGDFVSIRPRHVMTHDNTSAVLQKFKAIGCKRVLDARQPVFAIDHDIQNASPKNLAKYAAIEAFAKEQGIDFFPPGTGIGHQIMVERGYVLPGGFVVASDSHSNMYGALGAVGTPIVRTDAAAVWATGEFWWQIPPVVRCVFDGALPEGSTGKDVIITLCGLYPNDVLNAAVEFHGEGVASLDADARFTISNMSTEWGALVGWFPSDDVTRRYLDGRKLAFADAALAPDPDAHYAATIRLDLSKVTPHVSGPDTVQVMTSLAEIEGKRVAIQKAYLLSCVNSRYDDIAAAARVARGRHVAPGVSLYLAAASAEVESRAKADGHWQALVEAGAIPLSPGCGPCIGLGTGLLEAGEVGISATNRNFKGRMGSRDARCYLASPEVVAASAVAGYITGPRPSSAGAPSRVVEASPVAGGSPPAEVVEIVDGFPASVRGRLVFIPKDNLNTDGIYGGEYTYKDDVPPDEMARVVMKNYDPAFADKAAAGDVLVGGVNFGTGSSREQAVSALQAKGIRLLIAASISQTYQRNAFNNGFVCLEIPELVRDLEAASPKGELTVIPGGEIEVDFRSGEARFGGRVYRFQPLGKVPQSIVAAGGVENLVRARLGVS